MVSAYSHQFLASAFTFTTDELSGLLPPPAEPGAVAKLLGEISLGFGDLAGTPFGHLLTQSSIRCRPFIALGDETHFIPIPGLLGSFCVEILEGLIRKTPRLWERYLDRRSTFLEEKTHTLMREAFPEAAVERNLQWTDAATGKTFENDTLVVVGPVALICESKSSRVSDSARRGGPERLKRDFGNLVDAASEQASRTADLLERATGDVAFTRRDGTVVTVEASAIRRGVCVSITLDALPTVSLSWKMLLDAGLVSPSNRPAMSLPLADLIVVVETLAEPAIRLHYFWRRSEFEHRVEYIGDEEDLLVYYLSNGFGPLLAAAGTTDAPVSLWGNSEELHRYYMAKWHDPNRKVPPPRRHLRGWWLAVVRRVQRRTHAEKWDIACCLLDVPYEDQLELEQRFSGLVHSVRRRGRRAPTDAVIFRVPPADSGRAIVLFAYCELAYAERDGRISALINQARVQLDATQVAVLCRDVGSDIEPYSAIAYWDAERERGSITDPPS